MSYQNSKRRDFLKAGTAVLAGTVVTLIIKPTTVFASTQLQADIESNHGHKFVITLDDLMSNGPTSYNIQGSSGHPHEIVISQDMINAIENGQSVELESTAVAGHSHSVSISK